MVLQLDTRYGVRARLRRAERDVVRDYGSSGRRAGIPSSAVAATAGCAKARTVRIGSVYLGRLGSSVRLLVTTRVTPGVLVAIVRARKIEDELWTKPLSVATPLSTLTLT